MEQLTVLAGAGSALSVGIPSTGEVTDAVLAAFRKPVDRGLLARVPNVSDKVERFLARANRHYPPPSVYQDPDAEPVPERGANFEELLELIEAMSSMAGRWQRKLVRTCAEASMVQPEAGLEDLFDGDFLLGLETTLFHTVADMMRNASAGLAGRPKWPELGAFWRGLAGAAQLSVLTTNYDTLIEQALELGAEHQGFRKVDGENVWRLDAERLRSTAEHRLLHLHGGIHLGHREDEADPNRFCYEDDPVHDLYWHADPVIAWQTSHTMSGPRSQSGRRLKIGQIVTGLHKADKLLVEPYASYYHAAAEQLEACSRLLVIGYGFGDPHINTLLRKVARNPRRRVAVIGFVQYPDDYGSTVHSNMTGFVGRFGRTHWELQSDENRNPCPWTSPNGTTRFYWQGLGQVIDPEAAKDLVDFLLGSVGPGGNVRRS